MHKMFLRIIGVSFFMLSFSFLASSQKVNEDSLQQILTSKAADTTKIRTMRKLASYYILHKNDSIQGLALLNKAETLSRKIDFPFGLAEVLLTKGNYFFKISNWSAAVACFTEMQKTSERIFDKNLNARMQMVALNNLGGIFTSSGDYPTATEYFLKSREVLEKLDPEPNALVIVYLNLASMFLETGDYAKAANYLKDAYKYLPGAKPAQSIIYWSTKADYGFKNNDAGLVKITIDSLQEYIFKNELSAVLKMEAEFTLYDLKANYALTFLKNYDESLINFQKKLVVVQQAGDDVEIANTYFQIAKVYKEQNQNELAKKYFLQAFTLADSLKVVETSLSASTALSSIYNAEGNKSGAYEYLLKWKNISDSSRSYEKLKYNSLLEGRFQNTKKEKEIADLQLANAEKQLAVLKRNRIILFGSLIAAALLIILSLLYLNTRQKKRLADAEKKLKEEEIKFLERQQQLVSLQSMVNGQETERSRIAKDLHDGLGGLFSTVKMYFSSLVHEQQQLKDNELFKKSYEMVNTAAEEVRRIAHNMMPEVLIKMGLLQACQELCNSISAGRLLKVSQQSYGMEARLNPSTEIMLFRIIQELLNNIIKHAQATEAIIQFNRNQNTLSVIIEDNGKGFKLMDTGTNKQAGLDSIKDRVTYLNGKLIIESEQEVGTTIMMEFLLQPS